MRIQAGAADAPSSNSQDLNATVAGKGKQGAHPGLSSWTCQELRNSRYTLRLASACFAHARNDHEFASQLAKFLEVGFDLIRDVDDVLIGEGGDLVAKA